MKDPDYYYTSETASLAEFKERGSRFLAYCFPIKNTHDFKKHLQLLKKEHPRAVHHCFAYRIGTDGSHFRASDDGEPSGTAGKPILGQIDSKNLTNILIVVVRYFGGSLLGIPGLINAYKTSASLVLQCTPIVQKAVQLTCELQFNYTEINEIMRILKQYNCAIIESDLQLFCKLQTGIPRKQFNEVISALKNTKNIEFHVPDQLIV